MKRNSSNSCPDSLLGDKIERLDFVYPSGEDVVVDGEAVAGGGGRGELGPHLQLLVGGGLEEQRCWGVAGAVERDVDPGDELLAAGLVAHLPDALQPRGPLVVVLGEEQPPADDLEEEPARVVEGEGLRAGLQRQAGQRQRRQRRDEDLVEGVHVPQHLLPELALDLLREGVARPEVAQYVSHRHHPAVPTTTPQRRPTTPRAEGAAGGCSYYRRRHEGQRERHGFSFSFGMGTERNGMDG
uniref:Uncharacterized protein n=1 Tax=Setaria italica TaxID=4555 RepID=K3Y9Q5_SETIT